MTPEVELTGDELIATRTLDADRALVWLALTTPEHLAAFWGGHHASVDAGSVVVELQPGGAFELDTVGPDGGRRRLRFVYEVVDEPSLLVFSEPVTGIATTVRLEPIADATRVTIHQRRLPPELQTARAASGLAGIIEQLDALVRQLRTDRKTTGET